MARIRTPRTTCLLATLLALSLAAGCSMHSADQASDSDGSAAAAAPPPPVPEPPPPPPPPAPAADRDLQHAVGTADDASDAGPDAGAAPDDDAAADRPVRDRGPQHASRGPAAAPVRDTPLPAFAPWPPPTPTSQDTIARSLVLGTAAGSWGAVADRFDAALSAAGYEDRAYYAVPGGFALATRIERIDRDGRPLSEPTRWVGSSGRRAWTLEAVLRELAGVPVGHYRTLVFVFSDTPFRSRPAPVTEALAERWRMDGFNRLPAALRGTPYGEAFRCDVLVYEFEQGAAGQPARFVDAGLAARRHLEASRILARLESTR